MAAVETSCIIPEDKQETALIIKRANSLRKVASLNHKERQSCDLQTKLIDMERKSLHAQLTKEERELKVQLMKLQSEKRSLEDNDFEGAEYIDSVSEAAGTWDLGQEVWAVHETDVINPYPVTIGRTRKISTPNYTGLSRSYFLARGQTNAGSQDDLTSISSSRVLPPIQKSSSRNLTFSGESTHSVRGSPRGSVVSLQSSVHTILSNDDQLQELWAGDPEAISSIRRAKKSVAQQKIGRLEHKWARSKSLKETGQRKGGSVNRSHSLRDPRRIIDHGYISSSSRGSSNGNLSRASSINCYKSSEYINKDTSDMHPEYTDSINDMQFDNLQISDLSKRSKPQFSLSCSPDDRDGAVWGWIKGVDPSTFVNEEPVPIIRKSSKKRKSPSKSLRIRTNQSTTGETPEQSPDQLDLPHSRDHSPLLNSPKLKSKVSSPKMVPSPSHLSVEKCFEILASSPTHFSGNITPDT